jgi:hypothetical protein
MAKNTKNTKNATTSQGKPITDFFTLASKPHLQPSKTRVSSSVSSQASSSEDIRSAGSPKTTGVLNNSKVASIVSKPPIGSSSEVHGREFLDGSESHSTKTSLSKPSFASSAIPSRSQDFQAHARASASLNNKKALSDTVKISDRRRNKCDSDSDMEMANTTNSTVSHSLILHWSTDSDIFPAQSEKSQKSSSFASRGFFSGRLPYSDQPVRRRGPRIHEGAGTVTNAYPGKQ